MSAEATSKDRPSGEQGRAEAIRISIAMCTHNRADLYEQCMQALMPQLGPEFEIFVVDSASEPSAAARIAEVAAKYQNVTFIRLDQPGLSLARNAALKRATGEWLATIDDDAAPAPNWAETALALTSKMTDDYAIIGGAVRPIYPPGTSPKLGPRWRQLISAVEMDEEYDQTDRPLIVAANLCFRRSALNEIGGFPENLGRVGKSLLSGEDKLCVNRLLGLGKRIWYSGKLSVGHHIQPERLERKWPRKRAYWDGRSDRRIEHMLGEKPSAARAASIFVKLIALSPLYFFAGEGEFDLRFWYNLGWLQENFTLLRAAT
ncbi:MAG: glycosyltransferase family 2 protein [Hyphomonadaceae bacterium]|nr:glycosyltransferase family 2 protein [Hyphomonadaceae bacterium]